VRAHLRRLVLPSELSERSRPALLAQDPMRVSRSRWIPSDERRRPLRLTHIEGPRETVFAVGPARPGQISFALQHYAEVSRRISVSLAYCRSTALGRIFHAV